MIELLRHPNCCKERISLLDALNQEDLCVSGSDQPKLFAGALESFYHKDQSANYIGTDKYTLNLRMVLGVSTRHVVARITAWDTKGTTEVPLSVYEVVYSDMRIVRDLFGNATVIFLQMSKQRVTFELMWPELLF